MSSQHKMSLQFWPDGSVLPTQNWDVGTRVVYRIGIFRSVLVGVSWYLLHLYQRKSRSVHFGIISFGGNPFFPQKECTCPLLREKGGTGPLFDTASPPFAEKRSSHQTSNTNRNTNRPVKSDTGNIPITKKLLVIPWYTTPVGTDRWVLTILIPTCILWNMQQ